MFDTIIKNGKIVTVDAVLAEDLAIQDGKIAKIGKNLGEAKEVIDAHGKFVFPGQLDTHAHMNDPGFTWREDYVFGSEAAAIGGVTTIIDMPLQNEPALTNKKIFHDKVAALKDSSVVDYAFWGGLIDDNVEDLIELDAQGVVALKSFIGPVSPDYSSCTMGIVREALEKTKSVDAMAGFHCEDYSIIKREEGRALKDGRNTRKGFFETRPLVAELIATESIIMLAKEFGAKVYICHVSHPDVAELIKKAKAEGVNVIGETCPHYLVFTEDNLIESGTIFKCAPPLRTAADREKLWDYVIDGTISCIGSDHSPCAPEEKDEQTHGVLGAWGGISGLQTGYQVMFDLAVTKRGLDPTLLAKRMAYDSAKAFGLYGKKGSLEVGFDADIVIIDPEKEWEITPDSLFYKNKISAFVGLKGRGLPICTLVRGQVVAKDNKIVAKHGYGQLVKKIK